MDGVTANVSIANEIQPSGELDLAFKVTDNPIYDLLGKLTVAWSDLDYVLRLVLKRKRGLSLNSAQFEDILNYSHGSLIDNLEKEFMSEPYILKKILEVGKKRNDGGLYARRSHYCHGFWVVDEQGETHCQRIMKDEWRKRTPYNQLDLMTLIQEISVISLTLNNLVPA